MEQFTLICNVSIQCEISLPLTTIFNKSLEEGTIPLEWKIAEVSAIFKKGNKTEPGNYRPVSLTSISCKLLESFITDQIRAFMELINYLATVNMVF